MLEVQGIFRKFDEALFSGNLFHVDLRYQKDQGAKNYMFYHLKESYINVLTLMTNF